MAAGSAAEASRNPITCELENHPCRASVTIRPGCELSRRRKFSHFDWLPTARKIPKVAGAATAPSTSQPRAAQPLLVPPYWSRRPDPDCARPDLEARASPWKLAQAEDVRT